MNNPLAIVPFQIPQYDSKGKTTGVLLSRLGVCYLSSNPAAYQWVIYDASIITAMVQLSSYTLSDPAEFPALLQALSHASSASTSTYTTTNA